MERNIKNKINIAIAEDNVNIAKAMEEKLKRFSEDIELKFKAKNGTDLLHKLKLKKNSDIDVILMDIEMPGMDGIAATSEVKKIFPEIKVIMLTVFDDEDKIFMAIRNGAIGYLLKEEPPESIINGIKTVLRGGASMSPMIAAKTFELLSRSEIRKDDAGKKEIEKFVLTKREVEILEHLKSGKEYKTIAEELFISPLTVRKHIENIYLKLQVHNKIQAVQKAIHHKIIK